MKICCSSVHFSDLTGIPGSQGCIFTQEEAERYGRLINLHGPVFLMTTGIFQAAGLSLCPIKSGGELLGYLMCVFSSELLTDDSERSLCKKSPWPYRLPCLKSGHLFPIRPGKQRSFWILSLTEGEMSYSDMVKSANYCNIAIDCPYICCIITFVEQFELNETRDCRHKGHCPEEAHRGLGEPVRGACRILVKHNNIILLLSQGADIQPHEQVAMAREYCGEIKNNDRSKLFRIRLYRHR